MNIKKTSWHYKLIKFFDFYPSNSLCPYVRQILAALAISAFLVIVAIAMFVVFVWSPGHVLLALMGIVGITAKELGLGLMVWGIYALAGIVFGGHYLRKKHRERNPVEKEPNIVMAYIKAKKEKICPTLNFE
jgi:hypothetical protein